MNIRQVDGCFELPWLCGEKAAEMTFQKIRGHKGAVYSKQRRHLEASTVSFQRKTTRAAGCKDRLH